MLIDLAEHLGGIAFLLFEYTVEVRDVVETALITDLGNRRGRVDELTGGMAQTDVDHIV